MLLFKGQSWFFWVVLTIAALPSPVGAAIHRNFWFDQRHSGRSFECRSPERNRRDTQPGQRLLPRDDDGWLREVQYPKRPVQPLPLDRNGSGVCSLRSGH
jgi:hypothetical protein